MPINFKNISGNGSVNAKKIGSGAMNFKIASPFITNGLILNLNTNDTTSYSGSGTTWTDISGNGYNATMNGTVPFTAGSPGYFTYSNTNIRFDGNNSLASKFGTAITIISIASITDLSKRSVLFSKYRTTSVYGYIFEVGTATGNWTNTLRYYAAGAGANNLDLRGSTSISANTKYMFSITHDIPSNAKQMYLNGNTFSASDASGSPLSVGDTGTFITPNSYIIGSYQPYSAIYSAMQQYAVFVYNKVLSSTEITSMYNYLKPIYGIS